MEGDRTANRAPSTGTKTFGTGKVPALRKTIGDVSDTAERERNESREIQHFLLSSKRRGSVLGPRNSPRSSLWLSSALLALLLLRSGPPSLSPGSALSFFIPHSAQSLPRHPPCSDTFRACWDAPAASKRAFAMGSQPPPPLPPRPPKSLPT